MGTRRYELEVRQHLNGPKKYCVPGREPDTADTLESDGLIKQEGNDVVVLKPDDLRVIAWQFGCQRILPRTRDAATLPRSRGRSGHGRSLRGRRRRVTARRFPPPWSVEDTGACYVVKDSG
jgi:hypothetical protein